jgi:glycosyltransferase involved in cell wall biosynthesis
MMFTSDPRDRQWPEVSIIISNYNASTYLPETLASLGNLKYPHYEVIVVDAGSNDSSVELVRICFPWVRVVALSERVGVATALNIGVQHSVGEILILDYNSDEIASPAWLMRLVSALQHAPGWSIVGSTRLVLGTNWPSLWSYYYRSWHCQTWSQ